MDEDHFDEALRFYQRTKYNPRRETLRPHVKNAYPILKQYAADRELIGYKKLADRLGTDERRYLSVILGTISRIEDKSGRPPLSAVAVQKNLRIPNDRFFDLIDQLQYSPVGATKDEIFEQIREDLKDEWD